MTVGSYFPHICVVILSSSESHKNIQYSPSAWIRKLIIQWRDGEFVSSQEPTIIISTLEWRTWVNSQNMPIRHDLHAPLEKGCSCVKEHLLFVCVVYISPHWPVRPVTP